MIDHLCWVDRISTLLLSRFLPPRCHGQSQDPEVMQAFMDIQTNPGNITKHMGNPKVMALLSKRPCSFQSLQTACRAFTSEHLLIRWHVFGRCYQCYGM